jgi:myosin heavy subunit
VEYAPEGFIEKNRDTVNEQITKVLSKSSHSIVAKFFEEPAAPAKAAKTDEATVESTPAPKGRFDFGAASERFRPGGSVANLKDHFNLADLQKPPGSKMIGGKSTASDLR